MTEQIHAGAFHGIPLWHSDDEGKTWWSGYLFSHDSHITREELLDMALGVIRDVPIKEK